MQQDNCVLPLHNLVLIIHLNVLSFRLILVLAILGFASLVEIIFIQFDVSIVSMLKEYTQKPTAPI